jgi:hypothetical protein
MASNDGWETVAPPPTAASAPSGNDGWETVAPSSSQDEPIKAAAKPSMGASFLAGTASALDFPLSAPGFVAATAAELATTTGGMLASPFTGETSKQAYGRGAKVGEAVGGALMNPMQKIMSMFDGAEAYAAAPLPQAMSWFGEKLQAGGKKLEEKTGIPSESVPLMANFGMSVAGTKGGAAAISKGKEMVKGSGTPERSKAPTGDIPPKPPEDSSPQEKAAFIDDLKKTLKERADKLPVVEAAIRNKETGAIERMGPKHDEARKAETVDTHEQGFVDEKGNFLTRQEAWNRAKKTGQIPEGQIPERPKEGLHSGDLRTAGDERFKVTPEQPTGEPKPIAEPTKPVTRDEHRMEIANLDTQMHEEMIKSLEAGIKGDNELAARHDSKFAELQKQVDQLKKDMPAATFKDKAAPTWEEVHDLTWDAKNIGEVFDRIQASDIGGAGQKALVAALNKSSYIRSTGFMPRDMRLEFTDKSGTSQPAIGFYHPDSHSIDLGQGGGVTTILHEAIHAGTHKLIEAGNTKAAKELTRLYDLHKQRAEGKYEKDLEQFKLNNPNATIKQLKEFEKTNKLDYGFENTHEFIAEAFTNGKFRNLLAEIPSDSTKPLSKLNNLWTKFKEAIADGLGVKDRTSLDDVLDQGIKIIEKSKTLDKAAKGDVTSIKEVTAEALASRMSKDIHKELEREGIPVAHDSPHKFGMFNWIKHALSGEGAMVKGAGTYLSTGNVQSKYYHEMAKGRAIEKAGNDFKDKWGFDPIDLTFMRDMVKKNEDWVAEHTRMAAYTYEEYLADTNSNMWRGKTKEDYNSFIEDQKAHAKQWQKELDKKKQEYSAIPESARADAAALRDTKVPTYHSSLDAKPEQLLDWNSTKQSGLVNRAFEALGIQTKTTIAEEKWSWTIQKLVGGGEQMIHHGAFVDSSNKPQRWTITRQGAGYRYTNNASPREGIARTLEEAKQGVRDSIEQAKDGERLYSELSKKFEPQGEARGHLTEGEAQNIGDTKASIALAEQGVIGNVHDAAGGKETKNRNYVVYDDTKIKQNFVGLASKAEEIKPPIDTTKTDPRDVKSPEEFHEIAADILEKHGEVEAVKFYEGYKAYQKTWLEPVGETEKFVGMNLKNKLANERIIHNQKDKILQELPDVKSRERVALAVDAGDLSMLTDAEKAVATKYSNLVRDIGERAVEHGVVKGLLEDYVTHIVDWTGAPKDAKTEFIEALLGTQQRDPSMRGMDVTSKFGKQRTFKTFADLQEYIDKANERIAAAGKSDFRLKIKTHDIADLYKEYALSMEKAIENKKLIDNLKQVRNPAGEPWVREVTKEDPLRRGFALIDSPQFSGYSVHENMVPALKFVFDAGPGDLMKALGAISNLTKRMNVIGSFFHAKSLMEVISGSQIPIWSPLKEVTLGGVDKLLGTKYSGITKAVDQYRNGGAGDNIDRWIKESGLQLEIPEDVSTGVITATGKFADEMIGKYGPKGRVLEKSLGTVEKYTLGYFDKFTWDFLHTGGKIMVADAKLDQARQQAAKAGKPFDEAAARKEIANFVNDSFGGLNWFDAATSARTKIGKELAMSTMSPQGRRGLQVLLFAPDWTLSTLRAFTAALPSKLNPLKWHPVEGIKGMTVPTTKADYARLYQFKTALTYLTLLNAINQITANRNIWDNKDPTRIEWPDGTSMQAMKHAMEPFHWMMDPDKTFANKLGFIPKAMVVGFAGVEYASPNAQKLVDPSGPGRLKAVGQMVLPFQAQAAVGAPEGEGAKRALLGTLGFPVYGSTKEQKKEARAAREKALKKAAKEYHQKAKEKGWE